MRYEPLRRQVVLELGIIAAVMVVLIAIVYFMSSTRDDYVESNKTSQHMLDAIDSEFKTLKTKYAFIKQNSTLYEEVKKKQDAGMLTITRPIVLEKFNQYKAQYGLNNLRLSVSPIQDIKDAAYVRTTSAISSSEVSVELDTLSDERIYELLDTMQQDLPGTCKLTRVLLSREHAIDNELLNALSQKGTYPLIKATIKFTWFSINPVENAAGANTNAK